MAGGFHTAITMAFDFKFPDVGEGITEGEVVKWLVKVGESVKADQVIVKVETDKAVVDLPAPRAGTILAINYKEGQRVPVGGVLVSIGERGEKTKSVSTQESEPKKKSEQGKKTGSVVGQLEEAPEEVEEKPLALAMTSAPLNIPGHVLAAPAVRKFALEQGVNLTQIKGSGTRGEILRSDIEQHLGKINSIPQQSVSVKKQFSEHGYEERIPLKGIRKSIANNMVSSLQQSAQVTFMEDIDVTKLALLREHENNRLEEEHKPVKLTFLPFIIKASIAALHENPLFNASIANEEIVIKKYFNIGVAVETDVGLMVPVVTGADQKSMIDIAAEIAALAQKARERTIALEEMQGSTFTITNYGSVGGTYATPIINLGEAAILGTGKIFERVIPSKVGMGVAVAKILPVSLTFDHCIADGAQAARFLESLKTFLEDPDHLLVELR